MAWWTVPAIIGGAGATNLLGQWFANSAAQRANAANQRIARQNMLAQRLRDAEANANARIIRERESAGYTDAEGNRVYYVPDVGWVTELSDGTQMLLDASQRNQLWESTVGEMLRREMIERQAGEAREDATRRDALLDVFSRTRTPTATDAGSMMTGSAALQSGDIAGGLSKAINRVLMRTGDATDAERTVSQAARDTARSGAGDAMTSRLRGMQFASGMEGDKYNRLNAALSGGRSPGAGGPVQYRAPQLPIPTGGAGNQALYMAGQRPAIQQPYANPDYSMSSYFDQLGDTGNNLLLWYLTRGGGTPQSGRLRGNA